MSSPKFRKFFNDMFEQHKELFLRFKLLNDDFATDRKKYQAEFNEVGKQVVDIIHDWEGRLCGHMEKGDKAVYSKNVADKFWTEIRAYFPYVDWVGVKNS